jgi:hypothetical protein
MKIVNRKPWRMAESFFTIQAAEIAHRRNSKCQGATSVVPKTATMSWWASAPAGYFLRMIALSSQEDEPSDEMLKILDENERKIPSIYFSTT